MKILSPAFRPLAASIAALFSLPAASALAGNFVWNNTTGNWSVASNWAGGVSPTGADVTDVLNFGGAVGTVVAPTTYVSTQNIPVDPFLLNQLVFAGTDSGTGLTHTLAGGRLRLTGAAPAITQNGTAGFVISLPIDLAAPTTFDGSGTGVVTVNGAISGNVNLTKNGTSTFRFGTAGNLIPSANSWVGNLAINAGTIRFNNNAASGPTALRANTVTLNTGASLLVQTGNGDDPAAGLRVGTLSGSGGLVQSRREVSGSDTFNFNSAPITITAIADGSYAGTLRNNVQGTLGTLDNTARLTVRGVGTQTFTGTLTIAEDVIVGSQATMVLAGGASLAGQTDGSIVLNGGTFRMDNTAGNLNRLREQTGTALDNNGGGNFVLVGNAGGTTESLGRLQTGATNARSGALRVQVVQPGVGATVLQFSSIRRDNSEFTAAPSNTWLPEYSTVDFSATGGILGTGANQPQVKFTTPPSIQLSGGLFTNTETGAANASVGWATVNGESFATYNTNFGVVAVATTPFSGSVSAPAANALLTGSATITTAGALSLNSLKIQPSASGQTLTIGSSDLSTTGLMLVGPTDFSIVEAGGTSGGFTGSQPRYVHVQNAGTTLTLAVTANKGGQALVKAGSGTLALEGANSAGTFATIINEGAVRAAQGSTLPGGELRFRGGVLEISGGGTFSRALGNTANTVNWSGFNPLDGINGNGISEDRGSGGFAAFGMDAIVDLNAAGPSNLIWEERHFVNSGYAVTFGSRTADRRLSFIDNINLADGGVAVNYNARQFQVVDNPNSTTDFATLSGVISGTLQNDLLKSGDGLLELTGTNSYVGATIIHEGVMVINGSIASSFLTSVRPGAILGGNGMVGAVKIENGGTLAPGNRLGNASVLITRDVTFSDGTAKLSMQIGGPAPGGDGLAGYDQLSIAGSIKLNGASLELLPINDFMAVEGQLFFLVNNDGSDAVDGTFGQGSSVMAGSQLFAISYGADFATNSFTGGNDIAVMAIPEPSAAALILAGVAGMASRRRRRPVA